MWMPPEAGTLAREIGKLNPSAVRHFDGFDKLSTGRAGSTARDFAKSSYGGRKIYSVLAETKYSPSLFD
jgi:hypothetical protein